MDTYDMDKRVIHRYLNEYTLKKKVHKPRPIYLVADATYFGNRNEGISWCVIVFRDPMKKENLWWTVTKQETESVYQRGKEVLEILGYTILSLTGDGFGGLRAAFVGIPYQMCHVHMERIVVRATTRNPVLEAGKVLLALTETLFYTEEHIFVERYQKYLQKYRDFLNERTTSMETGRSEFTHRELRSAVFSVQRFLPFLFTYTKDKNIPNTTNTLEGHFAHIKDIIGVHRGLSTPLKEKVLSSILHASTIAPSEERLEEII